MLFGPWSTKAGELLSRIIVGAPPEMRRGGLDDPPVSPLFAWERQQAALIRAQVERELARQSDTTQ